MVNAGDTAFVLLASALVFFMTPGLAFFYGGMVRRKNVLGILMQCFVLACLVSLQWVIFGYSIAFAPGNGFIGGLQWAGLKSVGLEPYGKYAATIPHQAFMIFQAMFAIITPALMIGAFAERMRFSGFILFSFLWATLVYDPVAHWAWGADGWLKNLGVLDFAGGTVVHINAGLAALVTALYLGRRRGYNHQPIPPHNLPFTVLGAGLLWFGWFGFNAGSALSANGLAVNAFVVTNTAAAAGGLGWMALEWIVNGTPTMFGTVTGAVAGLVAITPAAGYVGAAAAIIIGLLAGAACFAGVTVIKPALGYDDALDAFGVHGIGGMVGALATGVFATTAVNSAGGDGLLFGNPRLLLVQAVAVGVVAVYSAAVTLIISWVVDLLVGLRLSQPEEIIGLDLTQHHEAAYTVLE